MVVRQKRSAHSYERKQDERVDTVQYNTPRNILEIGKGAIDLVGDVCKALELQGTALIVAGPIVWNLYGQKVLSQLDPDVKSDVHIITNNTIRAAMDLAELVLSQGHDFIVGIGGGRVIDVGKFCAHVTKKPFVSIPTTMANDGLVSPIAVLHDEEDKHKSLGARMPDATLVDISIAMSGPAELIKAGIGDTISNQTALMDWHLSYIRTGEPMDNYARLMSRTAVEGLLNSRHDTICEDFLQQLADSLVLSGVAMEYAQSSRPVSGSEHLFSHACDSFSSAHNLHGIQTALGTVSVLVMLDEPYDFILSYLKRFDIDINPEHLGITEQDFVTCFQKAPEMRPNRYTSLNEADLSDMNLRDVYHKVMEETK